MWLQGEQVGLMLLHGVREEDLPRERIMLAEVSLPSPPTLACPTLNMHRV